MRVSSPATVSISVVSGPTSQRAPIRVAPRRNVPGSTTVSRPISTPTSISVLAGSTIVTPASACARWIRSWASRRTCASSTRVLTPSVSVGSVTECAPIALPVGAQQRQHVGQVELALRVVGRRAPQRLEQVAARERVDAGVDLADRLLLGRRVAGRLGLHHALDAARRRRGRRGRSRAGRRAPSSPSWPPRRSPRGRARAPDRLGGDQRHVAVEHEHRVVGVDVVGRRADGVAGAVGLLLDRHLDVLGQRVGERALRPVDDDDPAGAGLARGGDRPLDHRAARTAGAAPSGPSERIRVPSPAARISDGGSGHAGHRSIGLALGGRLMARHRFLVPGIGVRVPAPQSPLASGYDAYKQQRYFPRSSR